MARIFISHSNQNIPEVTALRDWLKEEGWQDLFLEIDPDHGPAAGERWIQALHKAADRCEAVLLLISKEWLASEWCWKEFRLALRLNRSIFGVLIDHTSIKDLPTELTATWQLANLAGGNDHDRFGDTTFSRGGLARLKNGLIKADIAPNAFTWPPENDLGRPPYRGMRPLEAEDAGIFFGREAPIMELLAKLRGLRELAPPRFLVIQGASGAGKSSFLRAGILPRLRRDSKNFLPLPVIRPERGVLTGENGLVHSLERAFTQYNLPIARKRLSDAVQTGIDALSPLLRQWIDKAKPSLIEGETFSQPPTLVLSIDQGEELFLAEGVKESDHFLALLSALLQDAHLNLLVLFTIRSDSYERLQTASTLEGIKQQPYSLPPMPRGMYQTIIEGPAARLASTKRPLKIDPQLTASLLDDLNQGDGKDALPLLAFTLERLYLDYHGAGELCLDNYREIDGIQGAIQAAADRAIAAAGREYSPPRDDDACLPLLRRGLIPWLASIDPKSQTPRRRVAKLTEIPEGSQPLIKQLIEQRLLTTDQENGEITVEPAHESLLRQWQLLHGWLREDALVLTTLDGLQQDARTWEAKGRDNAWLNHVAGQLEYAEQIKQRDDLAKFLTDTDRDYLQACREQENQRRDKELEEARKLAEAQRREVKAQKERVQQVRIGLLLVVFVAGIGIWGTEHEREVAQQERDAAQQERDQAKKSQNEAIAARNHSDELVNFMLFDLRDKLEPLGRLDLLEMPARKALAYFQQLGDTADMSPDQQHNLAGGMVNLGNVLVAQGNLEEALIAFRQSIDISKRLAEQDKNNAGWMRDLSVSHEKIGNVLMEQGDLAGALDAFRQSIDISKRLAEQDKNNAGWMRDLSVSHEKIGNVLMEQGDLAGALDAFRQSMDISKRLAEQDKNNAGWMRDLSVSHIKIGNVLMEQGDLAGALDAFRQSLDISKRLAEQDKNNAGWMRDLSVSHIKIGNVLKEQGDLAGALDAFRQSLDISKRLAEQDKNNAGWMRDLSVSHEKIGNVLMEQGDLAGALDAFRQSLDIRKRLAEQDKNNAGWMRDLSVSLDNMGNVLKEQGDLAGALDAFRQSMDIRKRLAEQDKNNAGWMRDLSVSHINMGNVLKEQGDLAGALDAFRQSLDISKRLAEQDKNNAGWQRDLAISHENMGRILEQMGRSEEAISHFQQEIATVEAVFGRFPTQKPFRFNLDFPRNKLLELLGPKGE